MKTIRAPKKIIETIQSVFLPAPELDTFVKNNFLNEDSILFNEDHLHLRQARIAYLWTNVANSRQQRTVAATCEIPKPSPLANKWDKAKYFYQMEQWFGHSNFDFLITINARIIQKVERNTAYAILDHELYHCGQNKDIYGAPMFTKKGARPVYALLGHDLEEFVGIWRRWGVKHAAGESVEMAAAAKRKPEITEAKVRALCGNN